MLQNHETGQMAEDGNLTTPSTLRIPVDIIPIDMNGNITKDGWTFTNCLITDLGAPKFSEENGTEQDVDVTFTFVTRVTN
jgi:hypothetical protein